MALRDLLAVCDPPDTPMERPTRAQWLALEAEVGRALPSDYRALLDRYGTGVLGAYDDDGAFFDLAWVLSPAAQLPNLAAIPNMLELTETLRQMHGRWPQLVPAPAYPEPGGLLFVGGTTTTHDIYWKTEGSPDAWTCAVCDRGLDHWLAWDGDLTSLLSALVTGDVPAWITEGVPAFPLVFRDLDRLAGARLR